MDKQTYTRSVENFKMVTFPENPEEGLTHEISEVEIRIECLPDKTITLIELELTFNDEKGRILVNIHKIYKDEVTIEDDFRGSIFWTLEAFDSLKESLTKHFQASTDDNPIDTFLNNIDYFEPDSFIKFTNYELGMRGSSALSVSTDACSYSKFVLVHQVNQASFIEVLLHKVTISIKYNELNEVTEMSVKGLIATEELNTEYKDIPILQSVYLPEEYITDKTFLSVEFQGQLPLRNFMGTQIKENPDEDADDIFTDGKYTHSFRTLEHYKLVNYEFVEHNLNAEYTEPFVQKMMIQELILDIEGTSDTYEIPMYRVLFDTNCSRTAIVGVTFEGSVTLPIAKFLKENSPVFREIHLPDEPFGQLPLVRFKLKMEDGMCQFFNNEHDRLKPEYKSLGVYINSKNSKIFRNIQYYTLIDMEFEYELEDNFLPHLEIKRLN